MQLGQLTLRREQAIDLLEELTGRHGCHRVGEDDELVPAVHTRYRTHVRLSGHVLGLDPVGAVTVPLVGRSFLVTIPSCCWSVLRDDDATVAEQFGARLS